MPNTWVKACHWIKDNTPEESRIMVWWDQGYWIEDVAERESLIDGSHVRDTQLSHYIGMVYCTQNDQYAAQVMHEYNADYLVFSTRELNYFKTIEKYSGQKGDNGLYERSRNEAFESEYFSVVYRSNDVWILELGCCGE